MIPINKKATIKNARRFLGGEFQQYKDLSQARFSIPYAMPSGVAVSGGAIDTVEKKQVNGLDPSMIVDTVLDTLNKMKADNAKLLKLRYVDNVRVVDLAYRIGYSERGTYKLLNNALYEFGLLFGLIVWA